MKIKINYFASLREEVGRGEDAIDSDEPSLTAEKVWVLATGQECLPDKVLVALNQEYVDLNTAVVDGDEVAFFPPVTGG
jgi:molybdopterin synthase sulfur carrier subunit